MAEHAHSRGLDRYKQHFRRSSEQATPGLLFAISFGIVVAFMSLPEQAQDLVGTGIPCIPRDVFSSLIAKILTGAFGTQHASMVKPFALALR